MTALQLAPGGKVLNLVAGDAEFEATAAFMADEYAAATATIRAAEAQIRAQEHRLRDAFASEIERASYNPFEISMSFSGGHRTENIDRILDAFRRKAWAMLFDRLGVKKVMSVAKRAEFEARLEKGELPEITADAIVGVILGMVDSLKDFATEAAREVFEILRPYRSEYKTNSAFRVGRRVILPHYVTPVWGGQGRFRVCHYRDAKLIAVDGVFHVLAGKGVMGDRKGPLVASIEASTEGRGETEFFRWKGFKNGNLHLEFKRLDLVKELNFLGAGERVLGKDGD
jgi:hypothetical protein